MKKKAIKFNKYYTGNKINVKACKTVPNPIKVPVTSYDLQFNEIEPFLSIDDAAKSIGITMQKLSYYVKFYVGKEMCDCKVLNGIIYRREEKNIF